MPCLVLMMSQPTSSSRKSANGLQRTMWRCVWTEGNSDSSISANLSISSKKGNDGKNESVHVRIKDVLLLPSLHMRLFSATRAAERGNVKLATPYSTLQFPDGTEDVLERAYFCVAASLVRIKQQKSSRSGSGGNNRTDCDTQR